MNSEDLLFRIAVGEGSSEPVEGLAVARSLSPGRNTEFAFGVRRTDEGLSTIDVPGVQLLTAFPGRGVTHFGQPTRICAMSSYQMQRALETGRLRLDAVVVVAAGTAARAGAAAAAGCAGAAIS